MHCDWECCGSALRSPSSYSPAITCFTSPGPCCWKNTTSAADESGLWYWWWYCSLRSGRCGCERCEARITGRSDPRCRRDFRQAGVGFLAELLQQALDSFGILIQLAQEDAAQLQASLND